MGNCSSCLGRGGRDHHESESSRLLDDDPYQSGYGYGTVGHGQHQGPDPEDLKREREALDSICQRASDSVIDIFSVQPQHYVPAIPATQNNTASPSRDASTASVGDRTPTESPRSQKGQESQDALRRSASPIPAEFANVKCVPLQISRRGQNLSAVPKHWGEVVMTTRGGKKTRPALEMGQTDSNGDDLFGVLRVK
ncbi:hypothetical protein AJ80_07248 [Polytolypa hystricis UAMH7299]|uniref:Late endosomal/lysosomal adaptor and MAPK and MTOR activator 1 n=1 Tax=Polytolypa hystricis (strain UAMH7299) TaxID=1447883 RepID=A0A2B7XPS1_POLH7|nr:hypothetical protein AJ80_07248 [Polytolypa hystricis UAMH7299]